MKILFHTTSLNFRGTGVAVTDYARFNQEVLGNESVICWDAEIPYIQDITTEPEVVRKLEKNYNVIGHRGLEDLQAIIDREKIDVTYFLRYGGKDFIPKNCRTAVHAIFQVCEPHGDRYAYISEWLSNAMNAKHGTSIPHVPHMVNLPAPTDNYREILGIPANDIVIGRMGAYGSFNLPFVKQAIIEILEERKDYTFLFVGTYPWIEHPKVKYLNAFSGLQTKSNLISTCDAMIHARINGESFGLTIIEALSMNKPILSWSGGEDQNHSLILKDSRLLYNSGDDFKESLLNIREIKKYEDWTQRVKRFEPVPVMNKFREVFL